MRSFKLPGHLAAALLLPMMATSVTAQLSSATYYLYLGNHPENANPGWHENVQGIAHDSDHWFITQTECIWRIPVTQALDSVTAGVGGVVRSNLSDAVPLATAGFNHYGDFECHEYSGQGYLIVPVERDGSQGALAVFRAANLEYVSHVSLASFGQTAASWAAVDPQGRIFSSGFDQLSEIHRYTIDWNELHQRGRLAVTNHERVALWDEAGVPLTLERLQGGGVSPRGELLYLVAGLNNTLLVTDGIHVIDLATGRRVQRSTNGSGYFNYEFFPGPFGQEPEGLTIWDLDDGRAPGISGQLHVLMLRNEWISDDDVFLKHYTHTITVSRSYAGTEDGTPQRPFNTVVEAYDLAWTGAIIAVRAGSYPQTFSLTKPVTLLATGGTAILGR